MSFFDTPATAKIQFLDSFMGLGIKVDMKREDLIHPYLSGNKFRKLKYNIAFAKANQFKTLLTYGGAFSNHIAATARAGQLEGFKTIGIVRGEELGLDIEKTLRENATLHYAHSCGMEFHFMTRSRYLEKGTSRFRKRELHRLEPFYEIPEGGTNALAIKGCMEILTKADAQYDYICCAAGTGGTVAGIIEAALPHQKVLAFSALKGDFLIDEIKKYTAKTNWQLVTDHHFGGYAKVDEALVDFINRFNKTTGIPLDPIYTGKMMYGLDAMTADGFFSKNTRILAVHTGGLQGIVGINDRLMKKGYPYSIHI